MDVTDDGETKGAAREPKSSCSEEQATSDEEQRNNEEEESTSNAPKRRHVAVLWRSASSILVLISQHVRKVNQPYINFS